MQCRAHKHPGIPSTPKMLFWTGKYPCQLSKGTNSSLGVPGKAWRSDAHTVLVRTDKSKEWGMIMSGDSMTESGQSVRRKGNI